MDPNIFINTRYTEPKITLFKRPAEEEKALQIIKDIKSKKIRFKPTTDKHIQMVDFLVDAVKRYDRSKTLTLIFSRNIVQVYNDADTYGLIEKSESTKIAEFEHTIKVLLPQVKN